MKDNEAAVMDDDSIILLAPACCHLSASQALDVRHQAGSVSGPTKEKEGFYCIATGQSLILHYKGENKADHHLSFGFSPSKFQIPATCKT